MNFNDICRKLHDNCRKMKKIKIISGKPTVKQTGASNKLSEPIVLYTPAKNNLQVKDFTYSEFKKTADKTPLTLAEWAAILHVSERTLQRYAKNNGTFAPINAERFHQINDVLNKGKKVFGKTSLFYEWLHSNPPMLEGELSFVSLTNYDGIQKILTQLGRIEHGILSGLFTGLQAGNIKKTFPAMAPGFMGAGGTLLACMLYIVPKTFRLLCWRYW